MSSLPAQSAEVRQRRTARPHTSMFVRMLLRAAVVRSGRAASAFCAMVVAAAVSTAMLNLYADVEAKLRKEFRSYGANVVVVGKDGTVLSDDALRIVDSRLVDPSIAAPFAYIVARTSAGQSVVVAGTDFERVKKLDRWWSVTAWPREANDALVGIRAAALLASKPFELRFQGRTVHLNPAGILQTGAEEDSRVYLSMRDFRAWTGVETSSIEVAATGSADQVNALVLRLAQAIPGAEVRPVRQIVEAEARVLGKTRAALIASSVLIILTAALCVLATLMGWVFDRRRDFAIMKALGASERLLNGFFAAEAAALGVGGALLGFAIGIGVAVWIGRVSFHAAVIPRASVLPLVLVGSVMVALAASALPLRLLRSIEPAVILRGD